MRVSVKRLEKVFGHDWQNSLSPFIVRQWPDGRVEFRADAAAIRDAVIKQIPSTVYDVRPVERCKWPWWAKLLAFFAGESFWEGEKDIGAGDTFRRLLGPVSDGWKEYKRWRHGSCGCDFRRGLWNAKYRYGGACCKQ